MAPDSLDVAQQLYYSGDQTRARFGTDAEYAQNYYSELVLFVSRATEGQPLERSRDLLDVGCGCGWSSYCFAKAGFQTVGIDLNPAAFEPPACPTLTLRVGNALELPFEDSSFDIIVSYQCIEHVSDPKAALKEMIRVCRPNGIVCVVGPNLLSPWLPIKFLARELLGGRFVFKRRATTPLHPYGNTLPEHISKFVWISGMLLWKVLDPRPIFTMRIPDGTPPFHGDNDACFICNPTDIAKFFRRQDLRVLESGRQGRPPLSHLFAGGTWVAAQKRAI